MNIFNPYRYGGEGLLPSLNNGLFSRYKFDGNGLDSVGGFNATTNGVTYVTNSLGQWASLSGTSRRIVTSFPHLNGRNQFSVSLVANLSQLNSRTDWFGGSTSSNTFLLRSENTLGLIAVSSGLSPSNVTNFGTSLFSVGVNMHLCITYNGTNLIAYIDGVEVGNILRSGTLGNGSNTEIGGSNSVREVYGLIKEVKFWDRGLTPAEVSNLSNNELSANFLP